MSLGEKIQDALNSQINMELGAFYTYLSAAAYFEAEGLSGLAAWMRHHADEEMIHAMKIYDFIHHSRGRVVLQAIPAPQHSWSSIQATFEAALEHEQRVTTSINALTDLAIAEHEHATESFLRWFIDEQVEEEKIVDEVLQKLKLISDFKPGLYMLDRELAAQTPAKSADTAD
jgi:ferritin